MGLSSVTFPSRGGWNQAQDGVLFVIQSVRVDIADRPLPLSLRGIAHRLRRAELRPVGFGRLCLLIPRLDFARAAQVHDVVQCGASIFIIFWKAGRAVSRATYSFIAGVSFIILNSIMK